MRSIFSHANLIKTTFHTKSFDPIFSLCSYIINFDMANLKNNTLYETATIIHFRLESVWKGLKKPWHSKSRNQELEAGSTKLIWKSCASSSCSVTGAAGGGGGGVAAVLDSDGEGKQADYTVERYVDVGSD